MSYQIKTTDEFEERFEKLTKKNKALAVMFAKAILKLKENPKIGKPLTHDLRGLRSLPVAGKWRIIYDIDEDQKLVILRSIGHRKRIYTDFP
jgi:addiction module RelE/StbE family toxin